MNRPSERNWIFLRGLVRGVGHWGNFAEQVQKVFPKDHFEFLEVPGNGVLWRQSSPWAVAEMVSQMRVQSAFVKNQKRFHMVGVSLGGMLATEWARRFPGEVEGLCLINTSAANHAKFYQRFRPQNWGAILEILLQKSVLERERRILKLMAHSQERRAEALAVWVAESEKHPIPRKNLLRQLVAAGSYRFPAEPPAPAVLLASKKDSFVSVVCTQNLASVWKVPAFYHPWAGHDLALDDPQWLLDCLKNMQ